MRIENDMNSEDENSNNFSALKNDNSHFFGKKVKKILKHLKMQHMHLEMNL